VLAKEGILTTCGRNWLISVWINAISNELVYTFSAEKPFWDRSTIISADSYIEHVDYPAKLFGITGKGIVHYDFVDKIIDDNNNLFVIAIPDSMEIAKYGELEE
jgi:hypothetical protein